MSTDFIPAAKPYIGDEERAQVDRVLRSGLLAQGPEVALFEEEFSLELAEGRPCVAVNSGTSGLHLGLIAAGIGPGDEVIVPSFTFAATGNAVRLAGATPVFADIEAESYGLAPESVEEMVTERTRAIMPVHLYGHPALMTDLCNIALRNELMIFEDAAQAHGAEHNGQKVGTFGVFGMFSLYPTKNITSGEGGIVVCENESIARRVRLLRNQGMEKQYQNEVIGFNNRMTDIHAAIGRVQLRRLRDWNRQRQHNAAYLSERLVGVKVPAAAVNVSHVFHQFTIRVGGGRERRDAFAQDLRERHGVGAGVYYPTPIHRLPSFAGSGISAELPVTDECSDSVLSLPVHPQLSVADLERIVHGVNILAQEGA